MQYSPNFHLSNSSPSTFENFPHKIPFSHPLYETSSQVISVDQTLHVPSYFAAIPTAIASNLNYFSQIDSYPLL